MINEELLEMVFSIGSDPRLYNKDKRRLVTIMNVRVLDQWVRWKTVASQEGQGPLNT
jgi:hypothetical protein